MSPMDPVNPMNPTLTLMFDSTSHTQGMEKHLLQHLWDLFVEDLKVKIEELKGKTAPGITVLPIEQAVRKVPATAFVKFAADYLLENRYARQFYIDENIGISLTNGDTVALCPGVASVQGSMQDAKDMPITQSQSGREPRGVLQEPSMRII